MKNYRLSAAVNSILIGVIVFFICFIILGFARPSTFFKYLVSLLFSLSSSALILKIQTDKNKGLILKDKEQKEAVLLLKKLEIMPDNQLIALLLQLFKKANLKAEVKGKVIYLESVKCYFDFSLTTSRAFLCEKIKQLDETNIIIFCNKILPECEDLLKDFSNRVAIIEGNLFYSILKRYEVLPSEIKVKTKQKNFFSCLILLLRKNFTKKRAITFTFIGITLLIFSRLTFFPKYYLISSLISLTFALCCLLFGKREQKRANEILPLEFV